MRATDRVGSAVFDRMRGTSAGADRVASADRATRGLPGLSVLWIALTALPTTLSLVLQSRVERGELVGAVDLPAASLAFALGAFVAIVAIQVPAAWLSDRTSSRWGRRVPYVAGGTLVTIPAVGAAIASRDLGVVIVSIALADIGLNVAQGAYQTYLVDLVPRTHVPRAAAFMFVGALAGNLVGVLLGLSYVNTEHSPGAADDAATRVVVGLLAVALIVMTITVRTILSSQGAIPGDVDRGHPRPTDRSRRRTHAYLGYLAVLLCFGCATSIPLGLASLYVYNALGQTDQTSAFFQARSVFMFSGASLAGAVVVLPAALATIRVGWRAVALGGCALGACGTAILAISSSLPTAFVGFLLVGAALGAFTPAGWWLLVHLVDGTRPGAALGIASIPMAVAPLGMALVFSSQTTLLSGSTGAPVRGALLAIIALFIVAAGLVSRIPDPNPALG